MATLDPTTEKRAVEWNHIAGYFHPRSDILPSDWAAEHRIVSDGDLAGGRWRWKLTPYLVQIVDFVARPWEYGARRGVVLKSAQVGYTEGVLGTIIGWSVAEDPAKVMVLQPTDKAAKEYSHEQIAQLLTMSPAVRDRLTVAPEITRGRGLRESKSTTLFQDFPGGFLVIAGGAADVNLRRRTVKRALADEIDAMKIRGEGEGDVLERLERRTDTYTRDGVMLVGSTPTNEGTSVVWREWLQSDQRKWFCPCPLCGEFQDLEWGGPKIEHGLKWPTRWVCCGETVRKTCATCGSQPGDPKRTPVHDTEDAHYVCQHCQGAITRESKAVMVQAGEWRVTRPEGRYPGWKLSVLFSLLGVKAEWSFVAGKFVDALADREKLKAFVNTMLGEVWTGREDWGPDVSNTYEGRAERYGDHPRGGPLEIPEGVGVLVAGIDLQKDWAEMLVRGYGVGDESWDVFHHRFEDLSPYDDELWERLEHYLVRPWVSASGARLRISSTMVDAGNWAREVYGFVGPRQRRGVYASKGNEGGRPGPPLSRSSRDTMRKREGARLFHINTDAFKTTLTGRLAVPRPGPGYVHFRGSDRRLCNGFDAEYFEQLRSERRILTRDKFGRPRYLWEQTRERNEAWDLHVLTLAAFDVILAQHPDLPEEMPRLVADVRHGPTVEDK